MPENQSHISRLHYECFFTTSRLINDNLRCGVVVAERIFFVGRRVINFTTMARSAVA
jgi:hypothetical protein